MELDVLKALQPKQLAQTSKRGNTAKFYRNETQNVRLVSKTKLRNASYGDVMTDRMSSQKDSKNSSASTFY